HNRMNAMAAIAAANHAGVKPATSIAALAKFAGVKRRLELRGVVRGVSVYDDFAHHPTAIEASIGALKQSIKPGERVIAVFEPRSNTMKQGAMRAVLASSLTAADRVFAYSGGVNWNVAEALVSLGAKASEAKDIDALVETLVRETKPGDHVLFMSNGGFGGIHAKLLQRLQA
ncbi:MAG: glutamate ligase domain-containing protein, partial [Casimicrobium sp.]